MYAFFIFAVGFFARPFSAIFFGYIGDRYGRRIALLSSIIVIFVPTLGVGFIPGYLKIGLLAPLILGLLRFFQGFAAGGEIPGAICYLAESVEPAQRSYMSSWAFVGSQIGSILSIIDSLFLESLVSSADLLQFGWRASFIIGGIIGVGGFFLRYRLHETIPFEVLEKNKEVLKFPLKKVLLSQKKHLLIGFFISILTLVGYRMVFVFSNIYLRVLGMTIVKSALVNAVMLLLSTILIPFVGKLGNHVNKKHLLLVSALGIILFSYPLYFSAAHAFLSIMLVCNTLVILFLTVHFAILPYFLAELFPTAVRYTCIGLSYNFCNAILGGTIPFIGLYLLNKTSNFTLPSVILIVASVFTILGVLTLKEKQTEV